MKKLMRIIVMMAVVSCLGVGNLMATPYVPQGAVTIMLDGVDYTAAYPSGWFGFPGDPTTIFAPWDHRWIDYSAYLTPGSWIIGLDAINFGDIGVDWYTGTSIPEGYPYDYEYLVLASLSGPNGTLVDDTLLRITASRTEINFGYFQALVSESQRYTVRFTWLNDKTNGTTYDANIGINDVFFDGAPSAVPEPSTLLLIGSGLVGIGVVRRRFRKE